MADSISEEVNERKNQPSGSAFKQQKLPAWQPILTAGTVLPTFFLIGIAFIPIGFGLLLSSNQVNEQQLEYTNCVSLPPVKEKCADVIAKNISTPCECHLNFTLSEKFNPDVFVYYGLSNFYQNHRRYVKSRDDKQLLGFRGMPSKDCEPFKSVEVKDGKEGPRLMHVAPCGAIANSLFNDTFEIWFYNEKRGAFSQIKLLRTGIAWATDKNAKFRNPPGEPLSEAFKGYTHPPNWRHNVWQLENNTKINNNNGYQNEALIVWMRTAALPTFRKLYARVDHSTVEENVNVKDGLPSGLYQARIKYNYPVTSFKGTKKLIISNTSWLGGKNPFLGVAYIAVGFVCLILSGLFLFVHKRFGKSTSDLLNVNQRTPF